MNVYDPWVNPMHDPQIYEPYTILPNKNNESFEGPIPMNATEVTKEKEMIDGSILSEYQMSSFKVPNARRRLLQMNQRMIFDKYADKSQFFNNYDDGNESEHDNYVDAELNNPKEYYDEDNVQELDDYIRNTNTMAKQIMTDAGVAGFDYEYADEDNVNLFQESNKNYYKAMNIYNSEPKKSKDDIATMIRDMEIKDDFKKIV